MIEPKTNLIPEECKGWKIDGVMYPVLEEAKLAAVERIFEPRMLGMLNEHQQVTAKAIAGQILDHDAEIMAILSLEAPKQRKPRCDKGTSRTKKIAPVAPSKP